MKRSLEDACFIAKLCEEYRGKDTVVLDLTGVTPIMDFFVITTGTNVRQMHALSDEIRVQMKARGHKAPATEGYEQSSWILQDWGDIILHSFLPEARELDQAALHRYLSFLWCPGEGTPLRRVRKLLPGEAMEIAIIQEGKESNQGVGYMDDGTMVVVENGNRHIGKTKVVNVTKVLQTAAGRMIFARPED